MIAATHNGSSADTAPRKIRDIIKESGDREKKPMTIAEKIELKTREIEEARNLAILRNAGTSYATLSIFEKANRPAPWGEQELREFVRRIREGDNETAVAKVRRVVARGKADGLTPEEIKKQVGPVKMGELEAVTLSGYVTRGGRQRAFDEGRFTHSGWLQIDLDAKDLNGADVEAIRDLLGKDPHILSAHLSPTGEGVKAIMRIPVCRTPEEHLRAFLAAEAYILATYGLQIDKATKDPTRVCFVTHDPGATWNGAPLSLAVPEEAEAENSELPPASLSTRSKGEGETPKKIGSGIVIHSRNAGADITLADVPDIIASIPRPDYSVWLAVCSGLWNTFGEQVTPILAAQWPEEKPNEYAEKFKHRTQEHTLGTVLHFAMEHGWRGRPPAIRATAARLSNAPLPDELPDLTRFGESDADNALRVYAVAGGNFHYVSETGQWIVWDGFRWTVDRDGKMVRLFLNVMDGTARQGLAAGKGGESVVKFSMRCRDSAKVMSGLSMLKSVEGVTIGASDLDADPWVIGTPGGMIDLKTGRAIQPDKRRLVTKSISCDLDPTATCPTWLRVIHTATAGDAELIRFLQAWFGYNLTGLTAEECLVFFYGLGANGKGTVTETCRKLMGDYAITAPESLFTTDRNSSATNDIARLAGCRMACAAELDEGSSFAESRLKAITGRDAITARFLHREFFDFVPTHKLTISGNHKPNVRGVDHGIWRRIRLVTFTVTIPKEERDTHLADKLRDELQGILNWAIEGCLIWQREGLQTPQCVAKATADYQANEDVVGQFLDDATEAETDDKTLQSSLFEAYQGWSEKQGIRKPMSATMLNRKLEERGLRKKKVNGGRYWDGIALKTEEGACFAPLIGKSLIPAHKENYRNGA